MLSKKYTWTLYLIITTIVISIAVQVYFNFKNYQTNKQLFINEIQNSLDNATDNYYVELAKKEDLFFSDNPESIFITNDNQTTWASASASSSGSDISITLNGFELEKDINKPNLNKFPKKLIQQTTKKDSILNVFFHGSNTSNDSISPIIKTLIKNDTSKFKNFVFSTASGSTDNKLITGLRTIYFSLTNDSLDFKQLNLLFNKELKRKNIQLKYKLNHYKYDHLISSNDSVSFGENIIKTLAKSTYLQKGEKIELLFPNQTKTYLKKGLLGILLSLLFAIAIIASLFYLLNIIKKQKQIAEIKNDFISNITHEFKTPITTIGLANEALKEFTLQGNTVKTEEYLDISNLQLQKLNLMVEKVLETSTLDSENLLLKKEEIDLVTLIKKCITNQPVSINFKTTYKNIKVNIDAFHFENVINNLLDNAIKYGGNKIKINLKKTNNNIVIKVSDNGIIPKNQKEKIFDKFYRIPKGDKHDVKGFGIGLYYAKKIIEKHNGTLELTNSKNTVFKIKIPFISNE